MTEVEAVELSVLIPNYNHSKYLSECITSVLEGLPDSSELIIIDDRSSDHSVTIIREFEKKDSRIRFLRNKKNKGINYTANRGLKEARGKFFTSISVDDLVSSQFFHETLRVLKMDSSIALCCSNYSYVFDENIEDIRENILYSTPHSYEIFHPNEIINVFKKSKFWIPGHTTIYQRDKLLHIGGFRERLKLYSDFYLNHRLALEFGAGYIPKTFNVMRIHKQSFTTQCHSNKQIKKTAFNSLLKVISEDSFSSLFKKSNLLRPLIKNNLKHFLFHPRYWKYFNLI